MILTDEKARLYQVALAVLLVTLIAGLTGVY
jgi:hypothetical protein